MRLRDIAKDIRETIDAGVAWVILYKDGRKWEHFETWALNNCVERKWDFEYNEWEYEEILYILEKDPNAVIFNGFESAIDTSNLDNIVAWLKYVYTHSSFRLAEEENAIVKAGKDNERIEEDMTINQVAKETREVINSRDDKEYITIYKTGKAWHYLTTTEIVEDATEDSELLEVISKDPNAVIVKVTDIHVNTDNLVNIARYYMDIYVYSGDKYRISNIRINGYTNEKKLDVVADKIQKILEDPKNINVWVVLYSTGMDDQWEYMTTNALGSPWAREWEFNSENEKQRYDLLYIHDIDPNAIILNAVDVYYNELFNSPPLNIKYDNTNQRFADYLLTLYNNDEQSKLSDHVNNIRNAPVIDWNDPNSTNHTHMRRYWVDFDAYTVVALLDDNGNCFVMDENYFPEDIDMRDINQLKTINMSGLDGCTTAEECYKKFGQECPEYIDTLCKLVLAFDYKRF